MAGSRRSHASSCSSIASWTSSHGSKQPSCASSQSSVSSVSSASSVSLSLSPQPEDEQHRDGTAGSSDGSEATSEETAVESTLPAPLTDRSAMDYIPANPAKSEHLAESADTETGASQLFSGAPSSPQTRFISPAQGRYRPINLSQELSAANAMSTLESHGSQAASSSDPTSLTAGYLANTNYHLSGPPTANPDPHSNAACNRLSAGDSCRGDQLDSTSTGHLTDTDYTIPSSPSCEAHESSTSPSGLFSSLYSGLYSAASSALSQVGSKWDEAWADLARRQPVRQQEYIDEAEQGKGCTVNTTLGRYFDVYDDHHYGSKTIDSFYDAPRSCNTPYTGNDPSVRARVTYKPYVAAQRYWKRKGTYGALPRQEGPRNNPTRRIGRREHLQAYSMPSTAE